jgi:predicted membrane chloride channel (bestrophin family)
MHFIRKYGIILKGFLLTLIIVIAKIWIDFSEIAFIQLNPIISSFLGGVFFTISILFAGAVADYKESEKIPGDIAVSLKSLMNDTLLIQNEKKIANSLTNLKKSIKELLKTINAELIKKSWSLKAIDFQLNKINFLLSDLSSLGVQMAIITRMRTELTTIDRLSHRIDTIEETSFIPAAYGIAETAVLSTIFLLLFIKNEWAYGGTIVVGLVSLVLTSLVLLIKDMDNPFEYENNSYADVDMTTLANLEKYWNNN